MRSDLRAWTIIIFLRRRFPPGTGVANNACLAPRELRRYCRPDAAAEELLRAALTRLGLSARAYHRVLKVARTIADLAGEETVGTAHISEAIQYRTLDRAAFGRARAAG